LENKLDSKKGFDDFYLFSLSFYQFIYDNFLIDIGWLYIRSL
jgi:hypothetical protein